MPFLPSFFAFYSLSYPLALFSLCLFYPSLFLADLCLIHFWFKAYFAKFYAHLRYYGNGVKALQSINIKEVIRKPI